MQVRNSTGNYYQSNVGSPSGSVGTNSNNSSPESAYAQQRSAYQLMDVSSPVSTYQQHHYNVHADHRQHHLQSAKLQNFQANLAVNNQYYAHQNYEAYNGHFMNGNYNANEQRAKSHHQQPHQQQPINRYNNNGYSSHPTAGCEQRTFIQQQQQQHQHQHQVYAQPQLSPNEQYAMNAQLPHQTYSPEQAPTFAYAETKNYVPQPIAVGKQRAKPIVNRVRNYRTKNNKKRKSSSDGNGTMCATKMAKMKDATIDDSIENSDDHRLTASMRERQRTQELNMAYSLLRQTIPCLPNDKLSKIQTVKLAKQYIEFLYDVLYYVYLPEAVRLTHANLKNSVLMAARDIEESAKLTPNMPPSYEKLSYAFSVWRMDNEMNEG